MTTLPLSHSPLSSPSLTEVVSTEFVRLVSSHEETYVLTVLMLHKLHVSHTSFLPLGIVRAEVKPEQLGSPAQHRAGSNT